MGRLLNQIAFQSLYYSSRPCVSAPRHLSRRSLGIPTPFQQPTLVCTHVLISSHPRVNGRKRKHEDLNTRSETQLRTPGNNLDWVEKREGEIGDPRRAARHSDEWIVDGPSIEGRERPGNEAVWGGERIGPKRSGRGNIMFPTARGVVYFTIWRAI